MSKEQPLRLHLGGEGVFNDTSELVINGHPISLNVLAIKEV